MCRDNGPGYATDSFRQFAATYAFLYTTSSPRYARGNDKTKMAVQITKNLLFKASDPYLALLAHRAMSIHMGYSPD